MPTDRVRDSCPAARHPGRPRGDRRRDSCPASRPSGGGLGGPLWLLRAGAVRCGGGVCSVCFGGVPPQD
eukprot:9303351-Alexandrium_andersonii.AAC.1